jgi:hypothetical protein
MCAASRSIHCASQPALILEAAVINAIKTVSDFVRGSRSHCAASARCVTAPRPAPPQPRGIVLQPRSCTTTATRALRALLHRCRTEPSRRHTEPPPAGRSAHIPQRYCGTPVPRKPRHPPPHSLPLAHNLAPQRATQARRGSPGRQPRRQAAPPQPPLSRLQRLQGRGGAQAPPPSYTPALPSCLPAAPGPPLPAAPRARPLTRARPGMQPGARGR